MSDTLVGHDPDAERATDILTRDFDPIDLEDKNGLLYVPHEVVRDRLIEATNNQFDWSIKQIIFRETSGEVRRATDRDTGEIVHPTVMIVLGTLTIPGLGSRDGIGAHPLDKGAGEDAAFKSADSDALKRAAMAFGVGLKQLYIDTGRAKRGGGSNGRPQSAPAARNASAPRSSGNAAPVASGARQSAPPAAAAKPTIQNPDAPASDKQVTFLLDLMKDHGYNPDDFDFSDPPLSKGEASKWIESLKASGRLPEGTTDPNA